MSAPASATQTILYSFWRSSCSWRIRIALNLKSIPFEMKPIDLLKNGGEQHQTEFEKINPIKTVPTLCIDGIILRDSLNILEYLEETRPQKPLLPDDVQKRVRVREICHLIIAGIQPLQNLRVMNYIGKDKEFEWARHWICNGFTALEKLLANSAGTYSVGDEITLADCCVVPQVYNARRFEVDLKSYPTIFRVDQELQTHPAFASTHPFQQPDCPSNARV